MLNAISTSLEEVGGHIGYRIRSAGQGYSTKLLELTLVKAQQMGIQRIFGHLCPGQASLELDHPKAWKCPHPQA